MNPILHPIFALLASVTRQELARQVAYRREENKILRARLPERLVATPQEKRRLLKFGRKLGVQLRDLISIVSDQSFVRWIRKKDAAHSAKQTSRKSGRPQTPDEIGELVLKLARKTAGATQGFLENSESCGSWDEFLQIQAHTLWQCDFLSTPIWTAKDLVDVYLQLFLHLDSHRVWISPSTNQLDSAWVMATSPQLSDARGRYGTRAPIRDAGQ